jgi:hypothetical protein
LQKREKPFKAFYRALKPGGILGITDHRADLFLLKRTADSDTARNPIGVQSMDLDTAASIAGIFGSATMVIGLPLVLLQLGLYSGLEGNRRAAPGT